MGIIEKIISIIAPFRCLACGLDGLLVCDDCMNTKFVGFGEPLEAKFGRSYALYDYSGLSSDLVRALKFDRARQASKIIARQLHEQLPHQSWDIVTWVPTSPKRARQRGYDQSKLIAKEFAHLRGLEFSQLLVRANHVRQVGSTRKEREVQMIGAFLSNGKVLSRYVLIIDDVRTTGSSLLSASDVLHEAGARKVDSAVFAAAREREG